MAALRTPGTGCPWDLEQNFETIAPYTIEEAYEVADAIARGSLADLREELGDLLLQVVFHARMAEEQGAFAFGDVVEEITTKLVRRHPHVFGDAKGLTPDAVKGLWAAIKAEEKREKAERANGGGDADLRTGALAFDWNDPRAVLSKLREELGEIGDALDADDHDGVAGEVGDLLFAVVNLARHLKVDPDGALRATNVKFERRFAAIARALAARGKSPTDATLAEMDALWDEAKAAEKSGR